MIMIEISRRPAKDEELLPMVETAMRHVERQLAELVAERAKPRDIDTPYPPAIFTGDIRDDDGRYMGRWTMPALWLE